MARTVADLPWLTISASESLRRHRELQRKIEEHKVQEVLDQLNVNRLKKEEEYRKLLTTSTAARKKRLHVRCSVAGDLAETETEDFETYAPEDAEYPLILDENTM